MLQEDDCGRYEAVAIGFLAMELLYWEARAFKEAGVRILHPNWSDERVKKEVCDIFLYAGG